MSSTHPEGSTHPEPDLSATELEDLARLEAIAQHSLGTYLLVGNAFAEIRDRHLYRASHPSFETYGRERWGVDIANGDSPERESGAALRNTPSEALPEACQETLSALGDDERMGVEIRFAVRKQGDQGVPADGQSPVAEPTADELLPALRWLLTQATGTIGQVAHQLETRGADIDDGARMRLQDDVLVLDAELAIVKALLLEVVDWDSELGRLLKDELPPLETDPDPDDDE